MPIYAFKCKGCDHNFDRILKLANYDSPQNCPECSSVDTHRRVTEVRFNLPGDNWASKNGRISAQMRKKNQRLDVKSKERSRDAPVATLAPNVNGERTNSWADAQKLAKSQGKHAGSYEPMVQKEKEKAK